MSIHQSIFVIFSTKQIQLHIATLCHFNMQKNIHYLHHQKIQNIQLIEKLDILWLKTTIPATFQIKPELLITCSCRNVRHFGKRNHSGQATQCLPHKIFC